MKKKIIIEKQSTTATTTDTDTTDRSDFSDDYDEYYSDSENTSSRDNKQVYIQNKKVQNNHKKQNDQKAGGKVNYTSIVDSNYKKPRSGTAQDNFTKNDILDKIENTIPLKTMQDKRYLEQMPLFKTWVKYYNTETKQFRTGGLLFKVAYPDYIMLINTSQKLTWSVQLKDNIIYIPDPRLLHKRQEQAKEKRKQRAEIVKQQKQDDAIIKDKLFELYKRGKLAAKK
jgi:hypothetical protein